MKPLTTIGDALLAKGADWRAELRAAEVPRRTPLPPSSTRLDRPDRGYVEQPEERVQAPPTRRRTETPVITAPTALIRFTRDPVPKLETPEMRPPEPEPAPPEPEEEPEEEPLPDPDWTGEAAPAEPTKQQRKERKRRTHLPLRRKLEAVQRALADGYGAKAAVAAEYGVSQSAVTMWVREYRETGTISGMSIPSDPQPAPAPIAPPPAPPPTVAPELEERVMAASKKSIGISDYSQAERDRFAKRILAGPRGENAKVARELGLSDASVSFWVSQYKKRQAKGGGERTLVSAPQSGPASIAPQSMAGDAPPLPTIRVGGFDNPTFEIHGLQAYLEHMIRLGVKAELKRRLGDD